MDLSQVDARARVFYSNLVNAECFEVGLCTQLASEGSLSSACDLWIANFSSATHTDWIVLKTQPQVYRKLYVCQLSRWHKSPCSVRNRNCAASIDVRVISIVRRYAVIYVSARHSHPVHVVQSYRLLRCSKATTETFVRYFEAGLRPSAALARHESTLLAGGGKTHRILANCQLNPTPRQVYHLYEKWRGGPCPVAARTQADVVEKLLTRDATFRAQGVKMVIQEEPFIVLVLTAIMQLAHDLPAAGVVVFVDSSRACSLKDTVVTYLVCATDAGAVPLAVLIHSADGCYTEAFTLLKSALGPTAFGGRGYPEVFMTDENQELRRSLQAVFSLSRLQLCAFHVSRAVWSWLCCPENNVLPEHRTHLMSTFKQLRVAGTLTRDQVVRSYPEFELLLARHEWRRGGHQTNNLVESTLRILKENVLGRVKARDVVELVDAITSGMETWCQRRLLQFANMRLYPRAAHSSEHATLANLALGNVSDGFYTAPPSASWTPNSPVNIVRPVKNRTSARMRLGVQPSSIKRRRCVSRYVACSRHSKVVK